MSEDQRLVLDLAEESVLSDPIGTYRRQLLDGSAVDLSSYDSDGVILIYLKGADGTVLFIDFEIP